MQDSLGSLLLRPQHCTSPACPRSTIYTQCFTFPEKLIFFLTAQLKVCPMQTGRQRCHIVKAGIRHCRAHCFRCLAMQSQYLGTTYTLPRIDNYAIVKCAAT